MAGGLGLLGSCSSYRPQRHHKEGVLIMSERWWNSCLSTISVRRGRAALLLQGVSRCSGLPCGLPLTVWGAQPIRNEYGSPAHYSTFCDATRVVVAGVGPSLQVCKYECKDVGHHLVSTGECKIADFSMVFGWSRKVIVWVFCLLRWPSSSGFLSFKVVLTQSPFFSPSLWYIDRF